MGYQENYVLDSKGKCVKVELLEKSTQVIVDVVTGFEAERLYAEHVALDGME